MELPGDTSLIFDPNSQCDVFLFEEDPAVGDVSCVPFAGQTTIPLNGTIPISFTETAIPGFYNLTVNDFSGLVHSPLQIGGHTVEVLSTVIAAQDMQYDSVSTIDNVFGRFTLNHNVLVDGTLEMRITEEGDMRATFDALTGDWSDIEFTTLFTACGSLGIPSLNHWMMGLFVLLITLLGTILLRARANPWRTPASS